MVYADTSALVAMFANEPRGGAVLRWFEQHPDADYRVSSWTLAETASALAIKVRRSEMHPDDLPRVWAEFGAACEGLLQVAKVQDEDYASAATLCLDPATGLRAGDALHLAVALRLGCDAMIGLDEALNRNARLRGLAPIAP